MLRVALAIGTRIQGLLGIAAAPDFTRDLISRDLSADQQAQLTHEGEISLTSEYDPDGYILTQRFVEDGEACCLLDAPLELTVPVRLLQGCDDSEVPWQTALRLSERLKATDVRVQLIKDGDHRLSRPEQLALMSDTLTELIQAVESASARTASG